MKIQLERLGLPGDTAMKVIMRRVGACSRTAPLLLLTFLLQAAGCAADQQEEPIEATITPFGSGSSVEPEGPVAAASSPFGDRSGGQDRPNAEATGIAQCGAFFISSGRSRDACLFTAGSCTDGATYAIFCERGACRCLRNAIEQAAPNIDGCPSSAETMSTACGWSLSTRGGNTSGQADDD